MQWCSINPDSVLSGPKPANMPDSSRKYFLTCPTTFPKVRISRKCHFVCCITFLMWCLLIWLTARISRSAAYSAGSDELMPLTFYYVFHSSCEFLQWRAVLSYFGRHNFVNTSSLYKKSGNSKLRAVFKIASTRKPAVINTGVLIRAHVHCHCAH
jgi:hypothetical protein